MSFMQRVHGCVKEQQSWILTENQKMGEAFMRFLEMSQTPNPAEYARVCWGMAKFLSEGNHYTLQLDRYLIALVDMANVCAAVEGEEPIAALCYRALDVLEAANRLGSAKDVAIRIEGQDEAFLADLANGEHGKLAMIRLHPESQEGLRNSLRAERKEAKAKRGRSKWFKDMKPVMALIVAVFVCAFKFLPHTAGARGTMYDRFQHVIAAFSGSDEL